MPKIFALLVPILGFLRQKKSSSPRRRAFIELTNIVKFTKLLLFTEFSVFHVLEERTIFTREM